MNEQCIPLAQNSPCIHLSWRKRRSNHLTMWRSQLESAENPWDQWHISQHLLHSKDTVNFQCSDPENQLLCTNFAVFFVNKINELKCKIARYAANLVWNDLLLDSDFSGSVILILRHSDQGECLNTKNLSPGS